jgi:hypothetical protein
VVKLCGPALDSVESGESASVYDVIEGISLQLRSVRVDTTLSAWRRLTPTYNRHSLLGTGRQRAPRFNSKRLGHRITSVDRRHFKTGVPLAQVLNSPHDLNALLVKM